MTSSGKADASRVNNDGEGRDTFWSRHGDDVILALLFVYVILLGIGTAAELFDIESILQWPIYR